jgi:hypothetical protein
MPVEHADLCSACPRRKRTLAHWSDSPALSDFHALCYVTSAFPARQPHQYGCQSLVGRRCSSDSGKQALCGLSEARRSSARYVQSELRDWLRAPPEGCILETYEPVNIWIIRMEGPESSPGLPSIYEGETFRCGEPRGVGQAASASS